MWRAYNGVGLHRINIKVSIPGWTCAVIIGRIPGLYYLHITQRRLTRAKMLNTWAAVTIIVGLTPIIVVSFCKALFM